MNEDDANKIKCKFSRGAGHDQEDHQIRIVSRRRLLATASAGAGLAASPFRINLLQAQEANIKIGFPVPLTGPYGTEAQDQVRAAQLAIAQFNDAGGRMSALGVKSGRDAFSL